MRIWVAEVRLCGSWDEIVYVWDVETGALRRRVLHPHRSHCHLALAPDGKALATSDVWYGGDYGEDTIRLYGIGTGQQVLTPEPRDDRAQVMALSADGARLFTGSSSGDAIIWDVRRGERSSEPTE